jgi:hypothetical protein
MQSMSKLIIQIRKAFIIQHIQVKKNQDIKVTLCRREFYLPLENMDVEALKTYLPWTVVSEVF